MKTDKALGLLAIGLGAAYLLWRIQVAGEGPVTFVSPFTSMQPGNPSPVASDGTGATSSGNPLTSLFQTIGNAFKAPGNATIDPAAPARAGTSVDPVGPPDTPTKTMQPVGPGPLLSQGNPEYLPNLGDPNFSAWNYLASAPPDLAWGIYLETGGVYVA